jgi:hypothetical protein
MYRPPLVAIHVSGGSISRSPRLALKARQFLRFSGNFFRKELQRNKGCNCVSCALYTTALPHRAASRKCGRARRSGRSWETVSSSARFILRVRHTLVKQWTLQEQVRRVQNWQRARGLWKVGRWRPALSGASAIPVGTRLAASRQTGQLPSLLSRKRRSYTSRRPSMALSMVTSSVYSMSLPTGMPMAMRVTRSPCRLSCWAR